MVYHSLTASYGKLSKYPRIFASFPQLPNPIIARDYADFNENRIYFPEDPNDPDIIDEYWEVVKFNQNWARNMARVVLNEYLNATFRDNVYQGMGYAVNIVDPEHNGAIDDWRDIKFHTINMRLERGCRIGILISESNVSYPTYWKASIENFKIEICDLFSGERWIQTINISALIPSRLPLLMELTEVYHKSINGISPLMGLITCISEIYTEIRSLLQYANKYDWVANIVDNRWLQYLTNVGLIVIQYLVFNSVDPLALVYLAININDLISKSSIIDLDKYITGKVEDLIRDKILNMISLPFAFDKYVFKTVGKQNENEAKNIIDNLQNKIDESIRQEKGKVAIVDVAKDVLWKGKTIYYYKNIKTGKIKSENEFKGYSYGDYRLTTKNGDPTSDNIVGDVYTKELLDEVNENILRYIMENVSTIYSSSFSTVIEREKINEYYSPSLSKEGWRRISPENWDLVASNPQASILQKNELPPFLPYSEVWKLEWKSNEIWQHYEIVRYEDGEPVYEWVNYTVTHFYEERVTFTLNAFGYDKDIKDIFHHKDVFKSPPHSLSHDDNLEHLLQKYVNDNFTKIRNEFIDVSKDEGKGENGSYDVVTWKNNTAWNEKYGYEISWLLGKDGEVIKALQEVIELIEADNEIYSNISVFSGDGQIASTLDDIEKERKWLLQKFKSNKPKYLRKDYYMEGGCYKSAGAKVIAKIREWFVNKIEKSLSKSQKGKVEEEIDNQLKKYGANFDYESYENNKKKYESSISQIGTIGFGGQMKLIGDWEENISLAISTTPDYFGAVGKNLFGKSYDDVAREEKWRFNVKNICLFGPTGLPVLPPTAVTPWIVTINSWYIHVDGHWSEFKVLDSNDEAIADPLFGHKGQMYSRRQSYVFDDVCHDGVEIGNCTTLNFNFDTMTLGIVPPGKLPIGDISGGIEECNSVGVKV